MIANIANSLLIILIILSIYNFYYFADNGQKNLPINARCKTLIMSVFAIALSVFMLLMVAYLISDFSISNVYFNSHQLKPLIYKISGVWGNHEGSMLMFLLMLSLYSMSLIFIPNAPSNLKSWVLCFQNLIICGITIYIFFASNPFILMKIIPESGLGLNPILQDVGLAIHPPILYLGYTGTSILFSGALAILLEQDINKRFLKILENYSRIIWFFLTLGILIGGWWAYRELGWGGYWFWDPVENISLMPWLSLTTLIHALITLRKSGHFIKWTILLAIMTFAFSLVGTFLVRSGILTSVHSFASDPERGIFILAITLIILTFALIIYTKNINKLHSPRLVNFFSREFFIFINNVILMTACFTVLLGILYPIILPILTNKFISVSGAYYSSIFKILIFMLFVFVNLGMVAKWGGNGARFSYIFEMLKVSASIIFSIFASGDVADNLDYVILFAIFYMIISLLITIIIKFRGAEKINFKFYNVVFIHLILGFLALFIMLNHLYQVDQELYIAEQEQIDILDNKLTLENIDYLQAENFLIRRAKFKVIDKNNNLYHLFPELRFYPVEQSNSNEAAIKHKIFYDLYIVIGQLNEEEKLALRLYYRPFMLQIWLCGILLASLVLINIFSYRGKYVENN